MIAIVDYGMGNLRSVEKGLLRVGHSACVTRDRDTIASATGVVLPGVGAFGACMANLERFGLTPVLRDVIERGRPFLGICVGMQVLFGESEEFGPVRGLGVLPGRVVQFRGAEVDGLRVPHMGWNRLERRQPTPLLEGVADGEYVYFVHSYYPVPDDSRLTTTTTPYGVRFASSVASGNLFACQFHPEKSQRVGLKILENFGRLVAGGSSEAR